MSLVSIVIPYYNKVETIHRAVKSVLEQTYSNWELFIIDDNSNILIYDVFKSTDERIAILVNEENLGPGPTRQRGLDLSKGEYVAFLDADDWWRDDFLEVSVGALLSDSKNEFGGAWSISETRYSDRTLLRKYSQCHHTRIRETILKFPRPWQTGSILWKRSACGVWGDLSTNQDYFFELTSSTNNNRLMKINEVMYFVDQTQGNHRNNLIINLEQLKNTFSLYCYFYTNLNHTLSNQFKIFLFHRYLRALLKLTEVIEEPYKQREFWISFERAYPWCRFFFRSRFLIKCTHWLLQRTPFKLYF